MQQHKLAVKKSGAAKILINISIEQMRILKILKKIIPYLIILIIVVLFINTYEGFFASPTMTCTCPTGYVAGGTSNSSKCYKCVTGAYSNGRCSTGTPTVAYKNCTCSNGKAVKCSDGTKVDNNKCYNCSPPYTNPKIITTGTYIDTVRCSSGSSTNAAFEVSPGLFCPI